jgi:heme exporter protein C
MRKTLIYLLGTAAAILLVRNLYVMLTILPDEAEQGMIYRIMFFHIPAWFTAGVAVMIGGTTSVLYLATGKLRYDAVSVSVTEVAVAFLCMGLFTGMIWARIIWGIWWTWDARLTSALVLVLLYTGYLILREGIGDPTQRAKISAVFNIFAFADVPIVWYSIEWFRTQHPGPVLRGGGQIDPSMKSVVYWNWLALLLLMVVFVLLRLRQEEMRRELDGLRRLAHAV